MTTKTNSYTIPRKVHPARGLLAEGSDRKHDGRFGRGEGDGMRINVGESITHTFAAPIKGTGDVRKTGTGTLRLSAVVDGGAVEDAPGFMILLR